MAGFDNDVMYADNVRFDGAKFPGQVTTNGELLIGSTAAPNIRVGNLTSPLGTITIGYSAPNITIDLAGGSVGVDSIAVQAFTAPGTNPVVPTGAGLMTVNGAVVAAQSIPVRSNSLAANTYQIEVQRAIAAAGSVANNVGLCSFNSAQFTVDGNGFVSALSGTTSWLDSAGGALANHTGYFATAAAAYTLPAGAINGDMVEIVDFIGGGVVVTAQGGDLIRISNTSSSVNGTATSTQIGDSLRLVFRAVGQVWVCVPGAAGNWILA
jgi:hypothetical protein